MNLTTPYTDFTLGVTVCSLEVSDYIPCKELQAICQLIDAEELRQSPVELHSQGATIVLFSRHDRGSFLEIDLQNQPTDQMEMVGLSVKCRADVADDVETELRRIRQRSEVATALLRGNLGLTTPGR